MDLRRSTELNILETVDLSTTLLYPGLRCNIACSNMSVKVDGLTSTSLNHFTDSFGDM